MIVILGNGGHAKVCADVVRLSEPTAPLSFQDFDLSAEVLDHNRHALYIIGVGDIALRRAVYSKLKRGAVGCIHPSVIGGNRWLISYGLQIMAGAIIQPGCTIGNNVLINTRASIDHDCIIGDHVHIAPGAILCGGVTVGEGAFIGAGAIIPEGRVVPAGAFVKAGAVFA